jgi:hypothetical protein
MKKLLILAAAASALAFPGLANAADVTGAWGLTINVADMTFHTTCNFKQDGATLGGTCVAADTPAGADPPKPSAVTGSVDGQTVKFGYDVTIGDMMIHVDFAGDLTSDTAMTGKFLVPAMGGEGAFTAAKS